MKVLITLAVLVAAAAALPADFFPVPAVNLPPTNRITNGQFADLGQFPHQVALRIQNPNNTNVFCGGSLISNSWIVSAAHCLDKALSLDVLLGHTNLADSTEPHHQVLFIQKKNIFVHEAWYQPDWINDIALIRLPVPIALNEHVQPIALPRKEEEREHSTGLVIVSGWGRISDIVQYITNELRFIEGPIMFNNGCVNYWDLIKPSHICLSTTATRRSACNGDSGGPMVHAPSGKLIGVVSFGSVYCESGYPAVFTRVTAFLDWIEKISGVTPN